jgi:hypothetical protein
MAVVARAHQLLGTFFEMDWRTVTFFAAVVFAGRLAALDCESRFQNLVCASPTSFTATTLYVYT